MQSLRAEIAILAVPPHAAQEVADRVVAAGIRALLNFAPAAVQVPRGVKINHVDLKTEIEGLAFFLGQPSAKHKPARPTRARPDGGSGDARWQPPSPRAAAATML